MKRRMIKGATKTILPDHVLHHCTGRYLTFVKPAPVEELVIDALTRMWFGGVQVEQLPGHVTSRFA